jgi:tetratricopeptide (TPR) repeat protein
MVQQKLSFFNGYAIALSVLFVCASTQTRAFRADESRIDTLEINKLLRHSKEQQWKDSYRSLEYANQALVLAQQTRYKTGIATANNLRGFCFWSFGDNDLAIQAALNALDIATQEKNSLLQAESSYILARGYMDVNESEKAHAFIDQAERLARASRDAELLCSIYNLKGVLFFIDNRVDSALILYNKALELGRQQHVNPINFPRIISNIGECYAPENPTLALQYFNQALTLAEETDNQIAKASITAIIGQSYLRKKDFNNAEKNLQSALQLARTLGLRRVIRHAYGGLVDIKLQKGQGNEAVVYLQKYYAVRDSLLNTSKVRQIVELESKHALELKEQNIKILEGEQRIQSLWNNLLILLVVFLIAASVGLYLAAVSVSKEPGDIKPGDRLPHATASGNSRKIQSHTGT